MRLPQWWRGFPLCTRAKTSASRHSFWTGCCWRWYLSCYVPISLEVSVSGMHDNIIWNLIGWLLRYINRLSLLKGGNMVRLETCAKGLASHKIKEYPINKLTTSQRVFTGVGMLSCLNLIALAKPNSFIHHIIFSYDRPSWNRCHQLDIILRVSTISAWTNGVHFR